MRSPPCPLPHGWLRFVLPVLLAPCFPPRCRAVFACSHALGHRQPFWRYCSACRAKPLSYSSFVLFVSCDRYLFGTWPGTHRFYKKYRSPTTILSSFVSWEFLEQRVFGAVEAPGGRRNAVQRDTPTYVYLQSLNRSIG